MPRRPIRKRTRGLSPNIKAWLDDQWPLPSSDGEFELMLDAKPGEYERLWATYRPGEPYIDPSAWLRSKHRTFLFENAITT
jgi:hypothetical protein